ncbi:hypothetical protein D3C72_1757350 [compost metagenome]
MALQGFHALQRDLGRGQQGLGNGVGVGAHQSACAQLDATKVAHDRRQHAFQVLVAQHVEHGPPGRAARFAIINGRRLPARQQRPAHMAGARMLRLQVIDHLLRAGAVRHRLHATDETAFLDDQFAVDGGGNGKRHGGCEGGQSSMIEEMRAVDESACSRGRSGHQFAQRRIAHLHNIEQSQRVQGGQGVDNVALGHGSFGDAAGLVQP